MYIFIPRRIKLKFGSAGIDIAHVDASVSWMFHSLGVAKADLLISRFTIQAFKQHSCQHDHGLGRLGLRSKESHGFLSVGSWGYLILLSDYCSSKMFWTLLQFVKPLPLF